MKQYQVLIWAILTGLQCSMIDLSPMLESATVDAPSTRKLHRQ